MTDRQLATIAWEGDSREVLLSFPDTVRRNLGFALFELQQGRLPSASTRRMRSIGPGVFEMKETDERGWYRLIYLARIEDTVHVLHCFEKQSRKTDRRDLEIARERMSRVLERLRRKQANGKRGK